MSDALFEGIMDDEGRVLNPNLVDYEIPRAFDIPEIEVINCCDYEPKGPFGGKEAGECARAAVISAVTNAIYDAVGVRIKKIPATPERVFNALKEKEKGK